MPTGSRRPSSASPTRTRSRGSPKPSLPRVATLASRPPSIPNSRKGSKSGKSRESRDGETFARCRNPRRSMKLPSLRCSVHYRPLHYLRSLLSRSLQSALADSTRLLPLGIFPIEGPCVSPHPRKRTFLLAPGAIFGSTGSLRSCDPSLDVDSPDLSPYPSFFVPRISDA